jgi:hypothetical protein
MWGEEKIWGVIPAGFRKMTDGRGACLAVREDHALEIDFSVCREDRPGARDSRYHGRSPLESIRLRGGDTVLVRRYRHGGLFRSLTGGCFFTWPPRPFRELAITEELRLRGLRTVEVYAACVERIYGPFYRGCLITRELRDAKDLWAVLQDGHVGRATEPSILRAAAEIVRAMHREGVYHSDLNMKNILVRFTAGGVQGYVIDFDQARLFLGKLPPLLARRNLDRLRRSVRKLDPNGRYLSAAGWNEFLEFYHEAADG